MKRILKNFLLTAACLLLVWSAGAQNKSYISNHRVIASMLSQAYGIPASVILAVAAVESSGGKGPAAKVLNNHFGVEGNNRFVNKKGHKSRYKQYDNEVASYMDFCKIIARKRFYHKLKGNDDSIAWIKAISKCGYSEAPEQWQQKVLGVLSSMRRLHTYGYGLAFGK